MWFHFYHWESGSLKNKLFSLSRSKFFLFGSETSACLRNHLCYIMWYSNWCLVLRLKKTLHAHTEKHLSLLCKAVSSDAQPRCFGCAVQLAGSRFPSQGVSPRPQQWPAGPHRASLHLVICLLAFTTSWGVPKSLTKQLIESWVMLWWKQYGLGHGVDSHVCQFLVLSWTPLWKCSAGILTLERYIETFVSKRSVTELFHSWVISFVTFLHLKFSVWNTADKLVYYRILLFSVVQF